MGVNFNIDNIYTYCAIYLCINFKIQELIIKFATNKIILTKYIYYHVEKRNYRN